MSRLLTWDNDTDILEMLNRHFKATSFERYPAAMITLILEDSAIKVLGKNYQKERIGKRKAEELYKVALKRMQSCYGRFFNITDFRAKDAYKVKFVTNFNRVYKTSDGIIYATPFNNVWRTIFYTHHAFERFEERVS